jgi:superfamily I DNA/RNA helicase
VNFRIADTFTDSLARLTGDEQKAAKTTAFDLQVGPAHPGLQFHKLDGARDPNFSSVRVNRDVRLIVHRTSGSLLLCYVDHHDKAYKWAERRKLQTHPKTGAAQLVEVRETVQEITVPRYVEEEQEAPPKPPLFAETSAEDLLGYGVPEEWLEDVRRADEDSVLELAVHLPDEAAQALLELATGGRPQLAQRVDEAADPFEHPDARRRFRVMENVEELERALEYPWEKWTIFLHPEQRQLVEREYGGPARVSGSAGTGKTVVALHRAAYLARASPDSRVLLTTFSDALANSLHTKLMRLIGYEPRLGERLEVRSLDAVGRRMYEADFDPVDLASRETIRQLLQESANEVEGHRFSSSFLLTEWEQVVDAWRLGAWEEYRDVRRLGRKTRLPEAQRRTLWEIFSGLRSRLDARGLLSTADMFTRLASHVAESERRPFDFAIVDEAQDVSVSQLRFLAALGGNRPDSLFFAGDLGQRIFQSPFSWKALGIDIRGRSRTLRINYRTSHQIRSQADRLLEAEVSDVDGNVEERGGTVSVFNGSSPVIRVLDSPEEEVRAVSEWLQGLRDSGVTPREMGIFVRSTAELERASGAAEDAGLPFEALTESFEAPGDKVSISTMHLAKGMEFRAVAVMACDDEVIPSQERIETVSDEADLEEVYDTERHLLYVACTRARDHLLVSSGDAPSEFLEDLRM